MNRLQIVIAVGLFLIVELFGWRQYLNKRASEAKRTVRRRFPRIKCLDYKSISMPRPSKSKTKAE